MPTNFEYVVWIKFKTNVFNNKCADQAVLN